MHVPVHPTSYHHLLTVYHSIPYSLLHSSKLYSSIVVRTSLSSSSGGNYITSIIHVLVLILFIWTTLLLLLIQDFSGVIYLLYLLRQLKKRYHVHRKSLEITTLIGEKEKKKTAWSLIAYILMAEI